jgi:hypothetical protein
MASSIDQLRDERTRCRQRLAQKKPSDRYRYLALLDLVRVEAQLGNMPDAIVALREAVASGGMGVHDVERLQNDTQFADLRLRPEFEPILASLGPSSTIGTPDFMYAQGEVARCESEALMCLACSAPLVEPLTHTHCGNMICARCVATLTVCPHTPCEGALDANSGSLSAAIPRVVLNRLNALKVHCPRCQHTLARIELAAHLLTCPVWCPHGCRQRVQPSEASLAAHAAVCAAVSVPCSASDVECMWHGARRDLAQHARKCSYVKQQGFLRRLLTTVTNLERRVRTLEGGPRTAQVGTGED